MTQHGQPNARTGCPKPQDTLQAPTKGDRAPKPCPQFHHSTKTPGQCPKPNPPKGFIPPPSLPPSPPHAQTLAQPHRYPEPKKRDKERDIWGQFPHSQHRRGGKEGDTEGHPTPGEPSAPSLPSRGGTYRLPRGAPAGLAPPPCQPKGHGTRGAQGRAATAAHGGVI